MKSVRLTPMNHTHTTLQTITEIVGDRGLELANMRGVQSVGVMPDEHRPSVLVCLYNWNPLVMLRARRALRGVPVTYRVVGAVVTADKRR